MYLSCSDDYLLFSNYLADMLTHKEVGALPSKYQKGIELHKLIDSFTDQNEDVRVVNKLLHPYVGKYAPVASDVIFDYYLARNWSDFHNLTLEDFCTKTYSIITRQIGTAPLKVKEITHRMIDDNFLQKYTTKEGLRFVFEKMNKRARFEVDFLKTLEAIEKEDKKINQLFLTFFPLMINEVKVFCSC
jgi:acyl carrier protein phosphodiesterase